VGKLSAGTAQGRYGKGERIEPLIIPQLREVKTDRGRLPVLVVFDAIDEPRQAAEDGYRRSARGWGLGACGHGGK